MKSSFLLAVWLLLLTGLLVAGPKRLEAQAHAPQIFFTDLDSGPENGGELVNGFSGAYVTLYGNFFGGSQSSSTVTWNGQHCLRVVPTVGAYSGWGTPYLWYQKIVVQLGPGCTGGTGNFIVTVNGRPSNGIPFTVRSGRIFCVSTSGNDHNSGTFAKGCWSTIPKARKEMKAGDVTYLENGVEQTTEDDYEANLAIQSNGSAGRPIALVAYPGATVTIGSAGGKQGYAVRTPNIGGYHYWTLAGFRVRSSSIGLEVSDGSSDFRVIAIDASCPTAIGHFQGACMDTGGGTSRIAFLGNYDHDNAQVSSEHGSTKGFHNMYFSTDSNHVTAAWNLIDGDTGQNACKGGRCNSCRGIQFHSSPDHGGGSKDPSGHDQFDLHVHDNVIRNTHCDGINFATVDPSQGTVEAYNNIIYHVGSGIVTGEESSYACINFAGILNNGPAPSGTAQIYNNTCYDFGARGNVDSGAFAITPSGALKANFRNNIIYALNGQSYLSPDSVSHAAAFGGSNNLFFGAGPGPSVFSSSKNLDPKFVNPKAGDFHLLPGSPAIDSGVNVALAADQDGVKRPQGSAYDIGAYEFSAGEHPASAQHSSGGH